MIAPVAYGDCAVGDYAVLIAMLRQFLQTINFVEGKQYSFAESVDDALAMLGAHV